MIMDGGQDHALSGLAPYHINCCFRHNYLRGTQKLRRQAQAVFVFVYICGYNVHVYHIYIYVLYIILEYDCLESRAVV